MSRLLPADETWKKGDEAWVEFDAGTYKCELVSYRKEFGVWTVKWANGDEEPKTVREKLLREAPTKRAKVETKCFVCAALGRREPNLDASQMMRYNIGGKTTGRNDVDAHLCCILCAPPSRALPWAGSASGAVWTAGVRMLQILHT